MKKILLLAALSLLLVSSQTEYVYFVRSARPVGEVVRYFEGKYDCIVKPSELSKDVEVLSVQSVHQQLGKYHDYAKVGKELHELAEKYPDRCQVVDIGTTLQGRTIWAIRFQPKKPSPGILFVGEHHAREWMSVEVPMALAHCFAETPNIDRRIVKWLETYDIWIIPMLNPDGHQFSIETNRLWRKNRHPFQAGTFGTDLNRNYAFKWGNMGTVANTDSDIYPGPNAFSEYETQAIKKLADSIPFLSAITYHTYGNMILYSWNFGYEMAPYQERLERIAVEMAKKSGLAKKKELNSNMITDYCYSVLKGTELYAASGDLCDYMYSTYGTPTYTYEMTNSTNGFINSDEEIEPTVNLVLPMTFELFDATPKEFGILYGKVTDSYGNPLSKDIYFKNIEFPFRTDPDTGRYHHVVPLGDSYLKVKVDGKDKFIKINPTGMMNWLPIVIGSSEKLRLSGKIADDSGAEIKRTVVLSDVSGTEIKKSVNSSKFSFTDLPKGKYYIKVYGIDTTSTQSITLERNIDLAIRSD